MLTEIGAGLGALKGAIDIAKGLNATLDAIKLAEVRIELLTLLGDARIALDDAREEIGQVREELRALKAKVAEQDQFTADLEAYELKPTGRGALAYHPKGLAPDLGDGRWLCPNCAAQSRKSHMYAEGRGPYSVLECHPCGLELVVNGRKPYTGGR